MSKASELAEVQRLFSQVQPVLQRFPNVVSVGVGMRQRKGKRTAEPCFVVGVTKKTDRTKRPLPKSILGVRVDVQLVRQPRLLFGLGSGGQCRTLGRDEEGQIGMVADSPHGPCAITALHVLATERVSMDVESSGLLNSKVEGRNLGDDYAPIGKLKRGAFSTHEDVALIALNSSVEPSGLLTESQTRLASPIPIKPDLCGHGVRFEVPGDVQASGVLLEFPVAGSFDTATGSDVFQNLAKFEIRQRKIRPGWSGSVIFSLGLEPLALISFGSSASADGSVPAFAYGFPLAPHWEAWGLSTLSGS